MNGFASRLDLRPNAFTTKRQELEEQGTVLIDLASGNATSNGI